MMTQKEINDMHRARFHDAPVVKLVPETTVYAWRRSVISIEFEEFTVMYFTSSCGLRAETVASWLVANPKLCHDIAMAHCEVNKLEPKATFRRVSIVNFNNDGLADKLQYDASILQQATAKPRDTVPDDDDIDAMIARAKAKKAAGA